ncbi:MAG: hypothetical protein HYU66_19045, partial [Armatimonadetes bacterium]|nr:hypothetical protein [Armatimonadota bacterium]
GGGDPGAGTGTGPVRRDPLAGLCGLMPRESGYPLLAKEGVPERCRPFLAEVRLLEDVLLSDRLRRELGPRGLHVSRRRVQVSAERYVGLGMARSLVINAAVMALYRWGGWRPDRLFEVLYQPWTR